LGITSFEPNLFKGALLKPTPQKQNPLPVGPSVETPPKSKNFLDNALTAGKMAIASVRGNIEELGNSTVRGVKKLASGGQNFLSNTVGLDPHVKTAIAFGGPGVPVNAFGIFSKDGVRIFGSVPGGQPLTPVFSFNPGGKFGKDTNPAFGLGLNVPLWRSSLFGNVQYFPMNDRISVNGGVLKVLPGGDANVPASLGGAASITLDPNQKFYDWTRLSSPSTIQNLTWQL
jgi:hypothetical protein